MRLMRLPFRPKTTRSHHTVERRDKRCITRQCSFCHIHQRHARQSEPNYLDVRRRQQAHRNHPQCDRLRIIAAGPGRIIRLVYSLEYDVQCRKMQGNRVQQVRAQQALEYGTPHGRNESYNHRLSVLRLTTLTERRRRGDMIQFYEINNDINKVDWIKPHLPCHVHNYEF